MATYATVGSSGTVGVADSAPYVRRFPIALIWVMCIAQFAVTGVLDFIKFNPDSLAPVWCAPAAVMVSTTVVRRYCGDRWAPRVLLALGALVVISSCAVLIGGTSVGYGMALASWDVAVGVALSYAYTFAMGPGRWVPTQAKQIPLVLLAYLAVAVPASFIGVLPGTSLSNPGLEGVWWGIQTTRHVFIDSISLFVIWWFPQNWRVHLRRDIYVQASAFPMLLLLAWILISAPDMQLTWLVLVPALWASMTSSMTAVVIGCLLGAGIASSVPLTIGIPAWFAGPLPPGVQIDLLAAAAAFLAVVMALYRWQAGELNDSLRAERRQVSRQAALIEGVFDSMHDAFLVLDEERRVVLANPAAHALFGEIHEGPILDWLPLKELKGVEEDWNGLRELVGKRANGSSTRHRGILDTSNKGLRQFEFEITALSTDPKLKTLVSIWDVTEQSLRTEELRSFAGVVAHDLKSPLTKLEGWLEVLDDESKDVLNPSAGHALDAAKRGGRQLREMIDDWLSVTVAHEGELRPVATDITDVLDEVKAQLEAPVDCLRVCAPHRVQVDPVMLRQLMANLISNAVKYADPRRPTQICVCTREGTEGWIEVVVRDNGIGIPLGEEQAIFADGHRAPAHAQQYVGTGRGLALCQRLVTRHGGEIRAERNTDGPGSMFIFTLPPAV